jgi:hypothetical protein
MRRATRAVVLATLGLLAAWDAAVIALAGPDASISRVVDDWARRYPAGTFAAGFVAGHLFWQRKRR